tara:strand:+ start:631 stop:894 length:264 start_codon:yes stop_codon:yes gene_type:complete
MELNYINVLLAFWLVTVLMSVWRLWWPSMQILEIIKPNALVVKWWFANAIIFVIMAVPMAPILLPSILSDKLRSHFVASYIGAIINE